MNRSVKCTGIRGKTVSGINFEKPKTLSYAQLKEENTALHKRNGELEQKFSKQSNALNVSQRNAKTFEKENKSLKLELEEEKQQHTEYVERLTDEWTSRNEMVTSKLSRCETKLEKLGVNPVSLSDVILTEQQERTKQEALVRAEVLKESLKENIASSQTFLQKIQEMSTQSREALNQLEC